jgi:hypothetical protein
LPARREKISRGLRVGYSGSYAIFYLHNENERDAAALAEHGGFAEG